MSRPSEKASDHDYRIFGLAPRASQAEVKRAYRELVKRWHPDHFEQETSSERHWAEEKFKEITGAYRRISLEWESQPEPGGNGQPGTEAKTEPKKETSTTTGAETGREAPGKASSENRGQNRRAKTARRRRTARARFFFDAPGPAILEIIRKTVASNTSPGNRRSLAIMLFLFMLISIITSLPGPSRLFHHPERTPEDATPEAAHNKTAPAPDNDIPSDNETSPDEDSLLETPTTSPPERNSSRENIRRPMPPHGRPGEEAYFTLGSTQAEVLRIQGAPSRIHGQTWVYGISDVQFKDGRAWRYNNFDGTLKVRLKPSAPPPKDPRPSFTLGSTSDEVLLAQGTPTRVEGNKWYFGFSEVHFKNGHVEDFDNYFGNLKIIILPSTPSNTGVQRGFFTIGSSRDEVLSVQGTPSSIQGNLWFYQFSNILFRDGKVQYVINAAGNLRFIPPEE